MDRLGFELKTLERELHFGQYSPARIGHTAQQVVFADWASAFREDAYEWKCRLRDGVFQERSEDWIARFMLQNQLGLVAMMNTVTGYMKAADAETGELYQEMLKVLEDLLVFFKEESLYFKAELKMPDLLRQRQLEVLLDRKNLLHGRMKGRGIEGRVQQAVLWRLENFMNQERCSFEAMEQMTGLAAGLLALLERNVPEGEAWSSRDFMRYFREAFKDGAGQQSSAEAQSDVPGNSVAAAREGAAPAGGMGGTPERLGQEVVAAVKGLNRLKISLTVKQLAALVRAFIGEGWIRIAEGDKMKTIYFIADHVETVGAVKLSGKNLYNHTVNLDLDECGMVARMLNSAAGMLKMEMAG